jgi:hypothetical protein
MGGWETLRPGCAGHGDGAMQKRKWPTATLAKPPARAAVRLTVAEMWHEILGFASHDVTEQRAGACDSDHRRAEKGAGEVGAEVNPKVHYLPFRDGHQILGAEHAPRKGQVRISPALVVWCPEGHPGLSPPSFQDSSRAGMRTRGPTPALGIFQNWLRLHLLNDDSAIFVDTNALDVSSNVVRAADRLVDRRTFEQIGS